MPQEDPKALDEDIQLLYTELFTFGLFGSPFGSPGSGVWKMSVLMAGADGPEEHAAHPGKAGARGTDQEHHRPAGVGQEVQGGIATNLACRFFMYRKKAALMGP